MAHSPEGVWGRWCGAPLRHYFGDIHNTARTPREVILPLSTGEAIRGVLGQVLGSPVREGHGHGQGSSMALRAFFTSPTHLHSPLCLTSVVLLYSPAAGPIQPLPHLAALPFSASVHVLRCSLLVEIPAQEIISCLLLTSHK